MCLHCVYVVHFSSAVTPTVPFIVTLSVIPRFFPGSLVVLGQAGSVSLIYACAEQVNRCLEGVNEIMERAGEQVIGGEGGSVACRSTQLHDHTRGNGTDTPIHDRQERTASDHASPHRPHLCHPRALSAGGGGNSILLIRHLACRVGA